MHTRASWPARDDRRTAFVWLTALWIILGIGFGFDFHNYLHELPPVPRIVHFHAVATTLWLLILTALVLLVEAGNVKLHRLLGWFASGFACIVVVLAPVSELSWQALNLRTPGAFPPQFLSIAFAGVFGFLFLVPYGIFLRRNPAAHRRVMMLAAIAMSDAGFSRLVGLVAPAPSGFLDTFLFYEGGNLILILFMLVLDLKRDRVMRQFVQGASLLVGAEVAGTCLFFNASWQSIARGWLEAWARHGMIW